MTGATLEWLEKMAHLDGRVSLDNQGCLVLRATLVDQGRLVSMDSLVRKEIADLMDGRAILVLQAFQVSRVRRAKGGHLPHPHQEFLVRRETAVTPELLVYLVDLVCLERTDFLDYQVRKVSLDCLVTVVYQDFLECPVHLD